MQDMSIYINLHETVLAYKHGDIEASHKIVNSFSDFLWRYVNLVCYGKFKAEDKCLRRFVSLFSPSLKRIEQYNYKKSVKDQLVESAYRINQLFNQYSETEIRNELICILLNMAKKYSDYERPSFHTYVERCFHFEAFRGLEHLITDPITRQEYEEYIDYVKCGNSETNFNDMVLKIDKSLSIKYSSTPVPVISDNCSVYEDENLNDNWISGVTCSNTFEMLTPFERKILVEHNINNKTDSQIGIEYGLCRATINRRRLGAIDKLKNALNIN